MGYMFYEKLTILKNNLKRKDSMDFNYPIYFCIAFIGIFCFSLKYGKNRS